MRRYETIVIADPDLGDDKRGALFERMEEIIPQQGGFLVEFDDWGVRKLAYEIKKKVRGHYVRLDYCGAGDTVDELERFFRIDDRVMKYMTILLEEEADVEAIKGAMAAEAEAKSAAAAESEEAAEETAETETAETEDADGTAETEEEA